MKKLILSTLSFVILLTGCSSEEPKSTPDLEMLVDGVYIGYDRTKFENISAPPEYYAEVITPDDSALSSFFSTPPKIYNNEETRYKNRTYETENAYGYYDKHGSVTYRTEDGLEIWKAVHYNLDFEEHPFKELDFMPLSELYKRFEDDLHKFIDDFEIYETNAMTAEEFAKTANELEPAYPEKGWCEPRDVYLIRARQYVNGIPIFTGISQTDDTTIFRNGSRIEMCYTKDGLEFFDIMGGYQILEEKSKNGEFINLKGAEQIIRDYYTLAYGYDYIIFDWCDLVYVAHFECEKTVLTPAWEFYVDLGPTPWRKQNMWLRINAYTGEFMR